MQVPGEAWLEFAIEPQPDGSTYRQRAVFFPRGLSGRLYWLAMLPFHGFIFSGMVNRIVATAEAADGQVPGSGVAVGPSMCGVRR